MSTVSCAIFRDLLSPPVCTWEADNASEELDNHIIKKTGGGEGIAFVVLVGNA